MEFQEQPKEKLVRDHEFAFVGGSKLPLTLEEADTLEDRGDCFLIQIATRDNIFDPDNPLPPETITVYKRHLTGHLIRERMQRIPTTDELAEMKKFIHQEPRGVQ